MPCSLDTREDDDAENDSDVAEAAGNSTRVEPTESGTFTISMRSEVLLGERVNLSTGSHNVTGIHPRHYYPNWYVAYGNDLQTLNPLTGRTVAKSGPYWHLYIGER